MQITKSKRYLPVKEYAAQHQISVQAVYKMIKTGRIKMKRIGTYMLVREE